MASLAITRGIPLSKISPKFLHSNATSHTTPFSAVAELIDNAYDPDVAAEELRVDKRVVHGKPCLTFTDNGAGMDFNHLLKMLSFGYCEKEAFEHLPNHLPIGHYGNGFKSGSMRLGKDAVVFTVCKTSASVGFLSQTYLESIGADCVFVPMIEYRLPHLERFKSQESRNNMEAVLKHSPFRTEHDLKGELKSLLKHRSSTGTKIVLYNLRRHQGGKLELDFESDTADIRNPEAHEVDFTSVYHRTSQVESSEYMRSLRVYCGLLFLRPRMKIIIRGVKVKTQIISKSLASTEIDVYKPSWLSKPLRIVLGFSTQIPLREDYGVMFYHRNRLIKPYEKLGYQKQPNDLGTGVVGVVQVDFLKPVHNKQDFEKDEKYNAIMSAIGLKLNDYWNEKKNGQSGPAAPTPSQMPDWSWVQCERCLKWRRLPDSIRVADLPDTFFCHMNPDPTHNRCDIPEEPEDEDEAVQRPTYAKTFKKNKEEKKRRKQADILAKEAELKAREAALLEAQHMQRMNEVASSQKSRQDIAALQRALLDAKKREEDHKRLIVKIQCQKKRVNNQEQSLFAVAHNLQSNATASTEVFEVASALTEDSPGSSKRGKRGRKRKGSGGSGGGGKKIMNITTEQGDMMTIERADTDDDEEEVAVQEPVVETDIAEEPSVPGESQFADVPDSLSPEAPPMSPDDLSDHEPNEPDEPDEPDAQQSSFALGSSPTLPTTAPPDSAVVTTPTATTTTTSADNAATTTTTTTTTTAAAASPSTPPSTSTTPPSASNTASATSPAASTSVASAASRAPASTVSASTSSASTASTSAADSSKVTSTPKTASTSTTAAAAAATTSSKAETTPIATSTPKPAASAKRRRREEKAAGAVIDLTLEGEEDHDGNDDSNGSVAEPRDVKPNKQELDRQMGRGGPAAPEQENGSSSSSAVKLTENNNTSELGGGGLDPGVTVKAEEDSKLGQGRGPAAPEQENGSSSSSAVELTENNNTSELGGGGLDPGVTVKAEEDSKLGQVRHKYRLLTQRFQTLQANVHRLLSFIVPDVNLGGQDDIEHIVTEMIRVNCKEANGGGDADSGGGSKEES